MIRIPDVPVFSHQDLIDALKELKKENIDIEAIVAYISNLTGLSEDRIYEEINE